MKPLGFQLKEESVLGSYLTAVHDKVRWGTETACPIVTTLEETPPRELLVCDNVTS